MFQKNSAGKKTHISGLARLGSFENELCPPDIPPLMDSSPYTGKTRLLTESAYVPCFSNPIDVQRNQQQSIDDFNNNLFAVSSNPVDVFQRFSSNPEDVFQRIPLANTFYSAQAVPFSANLQYPGSVLIQDHSILRALIENQGSNLKQNFKTERDMFSGSQETGLSTDMNTEISSVISNLEMGKRGFDPQEAPSSLAGPVDLDCLWNF